MSYSFQTFSIGQILTAAQMNQVEASIRDHVHGTAGVSAVSTFVNLTGHVTSVGNAAVLGSFTSAQLLAALTDETGTGAAVFGTSPVFTTQITTSKIVTASGSLVILPVAGAEVTIGDGTATDNGVLALDGGTNSGRGAGVVFRRGGVDKFYYGTESWILGNTSSTPCFFTVAGLGYKWMVNNSTTVAMELSSAGVFSVGSTGQFAVGATGIVTAGTVPLARMMRTEVQNSAVAATVTLDLGTVVAGDRILITGLVSSGTLGGTYLSAGKSSGGAVIDFAGWTDTFVVPCTSALSRTGLHAVCRVTTGGTLVLVITANGWTSPTVYGHAIVLNNG